MQKHANLFHIVMTLYAFGFVASIVFYRSEPIVVSTQEQVAVGTLSLNGALRGRGEARLKTIVNEGNPAAPSLPKDEKKI